MRSMSLMSLFAYLLMGILLFYAAAKTAQRSKRRLWRANGILLLAGAVLCAINAVVLSERLVGLGLFTPIGLFLVILGADGVRDFRRCRQPVEAQCIGSQVQRHKGVTTIRPKFRYRHEGRTLEGLGLNAYSKSAFDRMLDEDGPLTVHIDPDRPLICVHKPSYRRGGTVFLIITGLFFLLSAAAFLILG